MCRPLRNSADISALLCHSNLRLQAVFVWIVWMFPDAEHCQDRTFKLI